ncbi:MAG: diguanylate cyclase, partial [Gammaproteobacteria bacterium]|nr:diguanylate cyclase [Gammaproteobacteria bacterium]
HKVSYGQREIELTSTEFELLYFLAKNPGQVFSRSQFIEVARSALKYCQHSEQELSLVILEFDDFSLADDKYSYESVLWVLKRALECCELNIRTNDKIGRLSENQFAMVLPGTDIDAAFKIAQKCQQQIAAIETVMSGTCFDVVVSAGVTNTVLSGFHLEKMLHDVAVALKTSRQEGSAKVTKFKYKH